MNWHRSCDNAENDERGIDSMDGNLRQRLALCPNLPSLPGVALRVIELGRDPETGIGEIADAVSLDPALAAKLLKIANSPLYAQRRKVDNLRQAAMLLGLNATLTLALSFSLLERVDSDGAGIDYTGYWRRSLLAALASRVLGQRFGLGRPEELFLAGLLQDIGMLVLDRALPDTYPALVAGASTHDQLLAAEREQFAADHAEVSAWILEHWSMPAYLVEAARNSHATSIEEVVAREQRFCACVAFASWLAEVWSDGAGDFARFATRAQTLLELSPEALHEVLDTIGEAMPETASLFEVDLVDPVRVRAIIDNAREVLMVRTLRTLHQADEALAQAERMEERARAMEERSRRDVLTGAYNRVHLDECLHQAFVRTGGPDTTLSVAFIDIDHFKRVNDSHGHHVGDEVLREVVRRIDARIRTSDVLGRYGGEEFILMLPGTRCEQARMVLERLRSVIAASPCVIDGDTEVGVTISVGIATHGEVRQYESLVSLLRGADRALYTAKRQGRNRVEIHLSEGPP